MSIWNLSSGILKDPTFFPPFLDSDDSNPIPSCHYGCHLLPFLFSFGSLLSGVDLVTVWRYHWDIPSGYVKIAIEHAIYSGFSMIFPLNMVIFHSYVKLPEGNRVDTNYQWDDVPINKWNMSTWLRRTDPHCTRCTSKGRNGIMGYNLPRSYEPNISSHLQLEPDLSWFVTMELGTPIIRVLKACKSMVSLPVSSYITCKSMHIMHHQPQLSTSSVFWTRFSYFFS